MSLAIRKTARPIAINAATGSLSPAVVLTGGSFQQYGWLVSQLGPTSSALELAAALRARELSAVELLEACLAAIDARNPELNAVTWRDDEQARADAAQADRRLADGEDAAPFPGVPRPIKDLTPVAGWPVTYGSHGAPEGPSERSELVVDSLADAGFVLCGR